jgi:hypothetical protein
MPDMNCHKRQRPSCSFATPVKWLLLIACLVLGAHAARCQTPSDFSGKVVETTNAASYTYVLVDTGSAKLWAAAPQFEVKPGDVVTVGGGIPMENYHSKTLNRDFAVVYFTGSVKVNGSAPGDTGNAVELPPNHPPITGAAAKPTVDLSGIKKATGGKTVAEIFAGKAKLSGKPVKVRGKVVKYNAQILGKNWIHIQDGTGTPGSNDLTVTTATEAKIGDTILVSGVVHTDRDFGAGYKYSVIIEDATVTVE